MMVTAKENKQLKEEDQNIRELIGDIEKRMKQMLKEEKAQLLHEVDNAVKKKKSFMPDPKE